MREWVTCVDDTHYCLGSAMGPHPFPVMVREFQRVIGEEARRQLDELGVDVPDVVVACVGGGSNAIGLFTASSTPTSRLVGVEAAGGAAIGVGRTRASCTACGRMLLQDDDGQILEAHSISAGLDYPGVGPEHAYLAAIGRAEYPARTTTRCSTRCDDSRAPRASSPRSSPPTPSRGSCARRAARSRAGSTVLVGLSGRGDKDIEPTSPPSWRTGR